jgi:hypothetical protein
MAVGLLAVAAPMVAAAPASAPTPVEARAAIERGPATPAKAVRKAPVSPNPFGRAGDIAFLSAVVAVQDGRGTPPPPPPTTTTTAPPVTTTTAPPAPAPAPAAEQGSGRCGGDLPPCYIMMRESGGNIRAQNPSSTASGKWQFLNSTWAGYGGYAEAWMAPESVQDAKARELWAGGAGCSHWSAC